jgi:arsenate reductase
MKREAKPKKRVLFLCTGNSARSQMAEGLVNSFLGDEWEAYSAGTAPAGYVHPLAIQAMAEWGIDILGQRSKSMDEFHNIEFDFVITLCDNAAQTCPLWLGSGRVRHISFPDPVAATGSEDERLQVFRQVRDGIRQEMMRYLEESTTGVGFYDKTTGNL